MIQPKLVIFIVAAAAVVVVVVVIDALEKQSSEINRPNHHRENLRVIFLNSPRSPLDKHIWFWYRKALDHSPHPLFSSFSRADPLITSDGRLI